MAADPLCLEWVKTKLTLVSVSSACGVHALHAPTTLTLSAVMPFCLKNEWAN